MSEGHVSAGPQQPGPQPHQTDRELMQTLTHAMVQARHLMEEWDELHALLQSPALSSVRSLSVLVVTCCVPCGMELTTRLGMRRDQALGLLRIGYATCPYHVRGTRPDLVLFDPRWRTGDSGFGAPFRPDPPEEWMHALGPILGWMVPVPG